MAGTASPSHAAGAKVTQAYSRLSTSVPDNLNQMAASEGGALKQSVKLAPEQPQQTPSPTAALASTALTVVLSLLYLSASAIAILINKHILVSGQQHGMHVAVRYCVMVGS